MVGLCPYGLDPLDPNLATEDPAGDGIDNLQKYQCDLDPLVPYVITTPLAVSSGMTNNTASIPAAGAGVSYAWSVTNGMITAGQDTTSITWTASNAGTATICVTLSNSSSCNLSLCTNIAVNNAYYVDYVGGNDAEINGLSPLSPWQHCPGDRIAVGRLRPWYQGSVPRRHGVFQGRGALCSHRVLYLRAGSHCRH